MLSGCETPATQKSGGTANGTLADVALKNRNIPKAIELYQKALIGDPFNIDIKNKLAACYILQNNTVEAIKIYKAVLKQDENNLNALRGIGRAYMLDGDATAARPYLERIVRVSPTGSNFSALGVVYDMLGAYKAAQQHYKLALEKSPNDLTILNNQSFSLLMTGDYKNAILVLEKIVSQERATPQQIGNLALAYMLNNQEDKATILLTKKLTAEEKAKNLAYFKDIKQRYTKGESLRTILFSKK
jgi:Flp pilus assembly protein TadD